MITDLLIKNDLKNTNDDIVLLIKNDLKNTNNNIVLLIKNILKNTVKNTEKRTKTIQIIKKNVDINL